MNKLKMLKLLKWWSSPKAPCLCINFIDLHINLVFDIWGIKALYQVGVGLIEGVLISEDKATFIIEFGGHPVIQCQTKITIRNFRGLPFNQWKIDKLFKMSNDRIFSQRWKTLLDIAVKLLISRILFIQSGSGFIIFSECLLKLGFYCGIGLLLKQDGIKSMFDLILKRAGKDNLIIQISRSIVTYITFGW